MPSPTFLIWDTETTGLNPDTDSITQLAAVRTDTNFNVIEEYNIRIQRRRDAIPSPAALVVTRTSPDDFQSGKTEYEAVKEIDWIINRPGTINLGYNSLKFDDKFVRFLFYRNLKPAYHHQFKNDCSRMDIYPIVLLAYLFYPNTLKWPVIEGKPTFKLEHLVRENGLSTGRSHDALVDVYDTLALLKKLASNQALWDEANAFFNKQKDEDKLDHCPTHKIIFGKKQPYGFLMDTYPQGELLPSICLGTHKTYKNQTCWLRLDTLDFSQLSFEEITEKAGIAKKRLAEPPFFFPNTDERCQEKCDRSKIALVQKNLAWIEANPENFNRIVEHFLSKTYASAPHCDPYSALYQLGFPDADTEFLFQKFHFFIETNQFEKALTLAMSAFKPTYQELAIRLLGNNFPDALTGEARQRYEYYISRVFAGQDFVNYRGEKRRTLADTLNEIDTLLPTCQESDARRILLALKQWCISRTLRQQNSMSNAGSVTLFSQSQSQRLSGSRRERDSAEPDGFTAAYQ